MQVLILGDDHRQQARLAAAMMKHGFQVFCVESAPAAASYIRNELIDVLVLTETRSGRISQSCACIAQSRNRAVSVIVMSNRTGPAMEELFEEVPQLYGVMGLDMAPAMVAALALASILPQQIEQVRAPLEQTLAAPVQPTVRAAADYCPATVAPVAPQPAPQLQTAPMAGQGAGLNRTLIEPIRRPVAAGAPAKPLVPSFAPVPSAQPTPPPLAPENRAAPLGPRWTNTSLTDTSDIGPDLAALERELALVNRDRPSVLAGSITEELPRWSQPAPKLAALTDWSLASPSSTDATPMTGPSGTGGRLKARADRRLELGATLQ